MTTITRWCLCLVALASFVGCSMYRQYKPVIPVYQTNAVVSMASNAVVAPAPQPFVGPTNAGYSPNGIPISPLVVTQLHERTIESHFPLMVTNFVQYPVTNYTIVTNYAVNPEFTNVVNTARGLNSAFNVTPFSAPVDWALSLSTVAASLFAAWKNKQKNQASAIAETVIKGVETFPTANEELKRHMRQISVIAGTAELLAEKVEEVVPDVKRFLDDGRLDANELHALASNPAIKETDVPAQYREAFKAYRSTGTVV